MGSAESSNRTIENYGIPKYRRWTREEVVKALTVSVTTDAKGKEIVKSGLLNLLNKPKKTAGREFSWVSIYDPDDPDRDLSTAKALGNAPFTDSSEDRSFGAFFGMAVGDAMGARYEFFPLQYGLNDVKDMGTGRGGKFLLQPGQWTDDTSLGLGVADSLLTKGCFDAHDMMHRFLAWWFCGLNNSGRFEEEDIYHGSCGLGKLMKASLVSYLSKPVVATESGTKESSGNGSMMRLAAIPIFFRDDIEQAQKVAEQQSLITHQGIEAAECCRLMAHIMVRGLAGEDLHAVLGSLSTSFKTDCPSVRALANSEAEKLKAKPKTSEGSDNPSPSSPPNATEVTDTPKEDDTPKKDGASTEAKKEDQAGAVAESEDMIDPDRNWNWKADDFKYSPSRVDSNPGYIGSYAMDAMVMALHILWKTSSLQEAILYAVNLRGDADTLAAIVGQIGGSFYGCSSIPTEWKQTVMQWDNHDIALRAHRLHERMLLK